MAISETSTTMYQLSSTTLVPSLWWSTA